MQGNEKSVLRRELKEKERENEKIRKVFRLEKVFWDETDWVGHKYWDKIEMRICRNTFKQVFIIDNKYFSSTFMISNISIFICPTNILFTFVVQNTI